MSLHALLRRLGAVLALAAVSALAHAQQADLVVNQADSPDPGPAGGVFTYTIRIDNNGPNAAPAVQFADTLPPGSTFVGVTTTQGTCSTPPGGVLCTIGDLPFLANATVTIQVRLPTAAVWTNTATATSAVTDPNTSNNLNVIEDTTAQIAADMTLSIAAPAAVAAGEAYTYAVTARNQGPNGLGATDTQTVAFTVPAGTCVTALPSGTGWACTPGTGYPRCSGAISCTRTGALAAAANAPTLNVPAVANVGGAVTAAFQVSASLPDGNPADNTVTATTTVTGGNADVAITKTASPSTVGLGSNVTYTLTPRHNGGEPPGTLAPNLITVTDTLPAGLTLAAQPTGSGWTCAPSTGFPIVAPVTVTCTRPGPYTGGNFTNMPAISIVATVTGTGAISNTATISAPESDPVPGNNSATVGITGSNDANLQMTKTASLNPVVPNQAFSYALVVRNLGPVALTATNTVTVTDTLPAGLTLTAIPSGTGWTCTPNAGFPLAGPVAISCTRAGPLAVNTNAPTITVPVLASVAAPLTNNACVALTGTGPSDNVSGNDCAGVTVSSTLAQADLRVVSKTAAPDPVLAGQDLTYVITVDNAGPDAATNVTVTDTLASLVTAGGFQSATPSQGTCTPSAVTAGPTVNLACNLGTLGNGAGATVTVVVRPSIALSGPRTNTATVNSPDVGDPVRTNNSGSVTSQVTAVADVTVSKTATPNPVRAGTPLTFVLTARNNGPSTASTVVATDTLPANAVFVSMGTVTGGGSCTPPAVGTQGGTLTCAWSSIAAAAQQTATYVVRPLTSAAGGNVVNAASITTTTLESNSGNNTGGSTTPVTAAQVDILVNKVDSIDPVALGQSTVYTVTTTNGGPSFATNVVMTDTFPTGSPTATFSYQGALAISPPGAGTCTEPAIGATSGTIACTFPGLASLSSAVVTYAMRAESIAAGVSGTTFNQASVTATEPETLPNNNQTTHATTSRRTADLAVVKTAPPSFVPGVAFPWTIVVTNNGPNDSVGATLTDVLPAGVAFQSVVPGGPACAHAAGTVSCTLGTLSTGASTTVTINVLPASPYTGATPLANTATVAAVNEVDPVAANNSSTATTTPGAAQVDLSLAKSGPASVLSLGGITWQIVIGNAGPSAADGATFVDTLPAGVTGVTASCGSPTGGAACGPVSVSAGSVSGTIATLPAGGTVTITIDGTAPTSGTLVNTATVSPPTGGVETNPGNNTGTSTTPVSPPDLTIVKAATGTFPQGQSAGYTLTVSNVGAGPTGGTVTVTDALPAGLTATSIGGTGWTCTLATLSCTRGDALAPGASYPPIAIAVDVAANAPSSLTNVATVGGGGETNLGNNQSSVTVPVTQVADLTVSKVANGTFSLGQVGATYALSVTNAGTGPTTAAVTLTDALPAGLTATAIAGAGWSCTLVPLACARSDVLAAGASYPPVTLTVNIALDAPLSVTNVATVAGGGEVVTTNNTGSVLTPLVPVPDLALVKTLAAPLVAGQPGAYTLAVTNVGSVATSGTVTVTDVLPPSLAATAISGTGWTCVLATLTCTRADALAPGASYPAITLAVLVPAGTTGTIVNTAAVNGGGEFNLANNNGLSTTTLGIVPPPEGIPALSPLALVALAVALAVAGMRRRRG